MAQLPVPEMNRLRWLFKLERQEAIQGERTGWVPIKADRSIVRRLQEKGYISPAVVTERGVGYTLTRQGSAAAGD